MTSSTPSHDAVRAADDAFFTALLDGDVATLAELLTDDFVIVDVMSGDVTSKDSLLDALADRVLRFVSVERDADEVTVRVRTGVGVAIGRTRMEMQFAGADVAARSRYTHIFIGERDRWQLMSAQGTPITTT